MQSCLLGKNINRGQLIATNRPYAFVLKKEEAPAYCGQCLKSEGELKVQLKTCAKCGSEWYCGKECQKEAWQYHIADCKLARKCGHLPSEFLRLIPRVLKQAKKSRHEDDGDLNWTALDTIQTHELTGKSGDDTFPVNTIQGITKTYAALYEDKPATEEEEEWRLTVVKSVLTQFKEIQNNLLETIGLGFYLSFSVLKHSCDPMAILTFTGTTAHLRAVREPRSPDEVATISYSSIYSDRRSRQKALIYRFFLKCECHRCTDEELDPKMHTFRCSETGCDKLLNLKDRSCSSGHVLTDSYRKTVIRDIVECEKYYKVLSARAESNTDCIEAKKLFLQTSLSVDNTSRIRLGLALRNWEEKLTPDTALIAKLLVKGIQNTYPASMHQICHWFSNKIGLWEVEQGQQQADEAKQLKWAAEQQIGDAMNRQEKGHQQMKRARHQMSDFYGCTLPDVKDPSDVSSTSSSLGGLSGILNLSLELPQFWYQQPCEKFEDGYDEKTRYDSMSMDGEAGEIGLSNINDLANERGISPTNEVADLNPTEQGPERCPHCHSRTGTFLRSKSQPVKRSRRFSF